MGDSIYNQNSSLQKKIRLLGQILSGFSVLIGMSGLIGWVSGIQGLRQVSSLFPTMTFITALALIILGLSALLLSFESIGVKRARWRRIVVLLAASLAFLIGFSVLLEYLFGVRLALDVIIGTWSRHFFPRKPAPETALSICFISASILLYHVKSIPAKVSFILDGLGASMPLLILTGYFYGEIRVYSPFLKSDVIGMAPNTAVGLLASVFGGILGRIDHPLTLLLKRPTGGGLIARRLVLAYMFLPFLFGFFHSIASSYGFFSRQIVQALNLYLAITFFVAVTWVSSLKIDLTEDKLKKSEERLSHLLEKLKKINEAENTLRRRLESISRATQEISNALAHLSSLDLQSVLKTILLQAQSLTGAEMAALGIGEDPSQPFDPWIYNGVDDGIAGLFGQIPRPAGILGKVMEKNKPLRLNGPELNSIIQGMKPYSGPMRNFLGVPIRFGGKNKGNLYMANKSEGDEFSREDQLTLEMLAARAGTAIEIAHLYKAESMEKAWLNAIIDQMPEGIVIINDRGQITIQNRVALSWSIGETGRVDEWKNPIIYDMRKPSGAILPWDEIPLVKAWKTGEKVIDVEIALRTKGGVMVPILANAVPVTGPNGAMAGAVVIFRDISQIKDLEKLREEWTSVVAHDLRQPVSTIAMAAETLQDLKGLLSRKEEIEVIETISTDALRLNRMVADLLDASLVESGHMSIDKHNVNLFEFLEKETVSFQRLTPDRRILFKSEQDLSLTVSMDEHRISQVLNNLLSNAVKYSEAGTPIEVSMEGGLTECRVEVVNYGKGLDEDQCSNVFNRFYRAPGASKMAPGIGLGLFICKKLIEAHGGHIWVESVPGRKTSFIFTLPVSGVGQSQAAKLEACV